MANIQDGSAAFKIRDLREEKLKQEMVDLAYPVGIVVAIANDNKPDFMNYGKWEKVAPDRVLWGAGKHTPGTIIAAGLPNITATGVSGISTSNNLTTFSGAIYWDKSETFPKSGTCMVYNSSSGTGARAPDRFDASRSNSIYGNSTTVQPDAYVVIFWKRVE